LIHRLFLSEGWLLVLDAPIHVCGDIHGQFVDLLHVFELVGIPPLSRSLFPSDDVDCGKRSLKVIILLFVLKLRFPDYVFLLWGNHELTEMTELFGFRDECGEKYGIPLWGIFLRVFESLTP
jgi:serine/threonine-protein phosphatase PP1 catalytic subunit